MNQPNHPTQAVTIEATNDTVTQQDTATDTAHTNTAAMHQNIVDDVHRQLSPDDVLFDMADMFKAMSDPTRLKIINALMVTEMCVADLTALLNMTQPAVSHHLKALRQARLIKFRRDGKSAYYSLDDDHITLLFKQCETHVWEER